MALSLRELMKDLPAERRAWICTEADRLHRAYIAHRNFLETGVPGGSTPSDHDGKGMACPERSQDVRNSEPGV